MGSAASAMKRNERTRPKELLKTELEWTGGATDDDHEADDEMCLLPEDEKALRCLIDAAEIPVIDADEVVNGIVAMLHRRKNPTRDDFLAQGLPERLVDAIQVTFGTEDEEEEDEVENESQDRVRDEPEDNGLEADAALQRTRQDTAGDAFSGRKALVTSGDFGKIVESHLSTNRMPRTVSSAETEAAGGSLLKELRHMNSQDSFFEEASLPAADSGLALYRAALLSSSKGSDELVVNSHCAEEESQDENEARLVQPDQWKLGDMIGSGSFGDVFVGMNELNGHLIAVKVVTLQGREAEIMALDSEIGLMKSLHHPNIVGYLGSELQAEKGRFFIFQEWVPGGSVDSLLKKFGGRFSVTVCLRYTKQILRGLAYLHENNIMHRDIKGANILVDDRGAVKLADFGCSKRIAQDGTQSFGASTLTGTPFFMAPEVMMADQYGRRADVWSVGGVVLQMCTGSPPWKALKPRSAWALFNHIKQTTGPPPVPDDLPPVLRVFLLRCFERDPQQRPHATDLLLDPWIKGELEMTDCQIGLQRSNSNLEMLDRVNERTDQYRRTRSAVADGGTPRTTPGSNKAGLSSTAAQLNGGGESGMLDQLRAAIGSNFRKYRTSFEDISEHRRKSGRPRRYSGTTNPQESPVHSPRRRPRRYTATKKADEENSVVDSDAPTPRAGQANHESVRHSSMGYEDDLDPAIALRRRLSSRQISLEDKRDLVSKSPREQGASTASSGTNVTHVAFSTLGPHGNDGSAASRERVLRKEASLNPYSSRSRSPASNRASPLNSPVNMVASRTGNPFGTRKRTLGGSPKSPARKGPDKGRSYFASDSRAHTTTHGKQTSPRRPESLTVVSPGVNPFANRSRGHAGGPIVHSMTSTTGRIHSADSDGAARRRTSGATPFRSEDISELLLHRSAIENGLSGEDHFNGSVSKTFRESTHAESEKTSPFPSGSVGTTQKGVLPKELDIHVAPLTATLTSPRGAHVLESPSSADEVLLASVPANGKPRGSSAKTDFVDDGSHQASSLERDENGNRHVDNDNRACRGLGSFGVSSLQEGADQHDFEAHENASGDE